jgi:hypothetical protein
MFGETSKTEQAMWEHGQRPNPVHYKAPNSGTAVAALHEMLEHIPSSLVSKRVEEFLAAKAAMRHVLDVWAQKRDVLLSPIHGFDPLNPVTLIRRCLDECPDEVPDEATPTLLFLKNEVLQESLRLDMSSAFQSFAGQQWKASCVLAASVIEALLHWALKGRDSELPGAVAKAQTRLMKSGGFSLPDDETRRTLHHYTEVAVELDIIGDAEAAKCRLARDARNLIHPGAEERTKAVCNQSAALSALAALTAVVDHLTKTRG